MKLPTTRHAHQGEGRWGPSRTVFWLVMAMAVFILVSLHGKLGPSQRRTTSVGHHDAAADALPDFTTLVKVPAKEPGRVTSPAEGAAVPADDTAAPAPVNDPKSTNSKDAAADSLSENSKDYPEDENDDTASASPVPRYPPPVSQRGPLFANLPYDPLVTLLVAIPTSADASEARYRSAVRATWGARLRSLRVPSLHAPAATAKLFFFIGTKGLTAPQQAALDKEAAKYGDLQFLRNVEESYEGLSRKMMAVHEWVHDNRVAYPTLRFVFKTDTDVWVQVNALLYMAETHAAEQTMLGFKYVRNVRMMKGKWANPEYSSPIYPQYMAGAGYLLSIDIASWIATNARSGWLKPLPNEDALLGIWLAGSPVKFIHSPKFKPLLDPRHPARITDLHPAVCQDDDILFHHLTPEGIRNLDQNYDECESPCVETCKQLAKERAEAEAEKARLVAEAEKEKARKVAEARGVDVGSTVQDADVPPAAPLKEPAVAVAAADTVARDAHGAPAADAARAEP
ncbi:hypothetical protein GGF31_006695 [Allomyces arbusculus]|nr:hypothetical protein GGF31_006695 [Allomyces arbusculus]